MIDQERKPTEAFVRYQLAEILGQPISVIESMPVLEFNGWLAYFKEKQNQLKVNQNGSSHHR